MGAKTKVNPKAALAHHVIGIGIGIGIDVGVGVGPSPHAFAFAYVCARTSVYIGGCSGPLEQPGAFRDHPLRLVHPPPPHLQHITTIHG